jgi:peptidyl-tRNA hydrolase
VLDTFAKAEQVLVKETLENGANALRMIIRDGALKAMQQFN